MILYLKQSLNEIYSSRDQKTYSGVEIWLQYQLNDESCLSLDLPYRTSILTVTNEPWKALSGPVYFL